MSDQGIPRFRCVHTDPFLWVIINKSRRNVVFEISGYNPSTVRSRIPHEAREVNTARESSGTESGVKQRANMDK